MGLPSLSSSERKVCTRDHYPTNERPVHQQQEARQLPPVGQMETHFQRLTLETVRMVDENMRSSTHGDPTSGFVDSNSFERIFRVVDVDSLE